MQVSAWLHTTTNTLQHHHIQTARLDCLVLLEDALGISRAEILAEPDRVIPRRTLAALEQLVNRRCRHEPIAYIRGKTEFYGRDFTVNSAVLVPRPESEDLIEILVANKHNMPPSASYVDIGTGSGCLAVTIAKELRAHSVIATDISSAALEVAIKNAQKHQVNIMPYCGDLLYALPANLPSPLIIIANLPYVPTNHTINQAATHEPPEALFAGADGLDDYRKLFEQIIANPEPPTLIVCESLPEQHKALSKLASEAHFTLIETRGFAQLFGRRS